jgi:hypothetical protein
MVINAVNSVSGHQWFSAVTAYSKELSDFIHYGEGRYCSGTSRARITTAVNNFMVGMSPKHRQNAIKKISRLSIRIRDRLSPLLWIENQALI